MIEKEREHVEVWRKLSFHDGQCGREVARVIPACARLGATNRLISKLWATSSSAISLEDEFPTQICTTCGGWPRTKARAREIGDGSDFR